MGFRFRKSVSLFGGAFRINFSKSGIGYSYGGKGARVTKTANGRPEQHYLYQEQAYLTLQNLVRRKHIDQYKEILSISLNTPLKPTKY